MSMVAGREQTSKAESAEAYRQGSSRAPYSVQNRPENVKTKVTVMTARTAPTAKSCTASTRRVVRGAGAARSCSRRENQQESKWG